MKVPMTVLLALVVFGVFATDGPIISQQEVERIVTVLADDAMAGRKAGTDGARKAAAFIADEFRKIGLKPYQGTDFRQPFDVYKTKRESGSLTINGNTIPPADYFISFQGKTVSLDDAQAFAAVHVAEGENTRRAFMKVYRSGKIPLLLLHESHRDRLAGIKRSRGGGLTTGDATKPDFIMAITSETQANAVSLSVNNTMKPTELANVVGMIEGKSKPNEYILFSAHYDHLGDEMTPVDGDTIGNGADDDASGTTAVIALANYFKKLPQQPERSLVFMAFTAEEIGGFGSKYFGTLIDPAQYIAGINIEMIGKISKFGKGQVFMTGYDKSDLFTIMQQAAGDKPFVHPDPYPQQNLFYRSDNATFARMGVPAHSLSSAQIDQDKYYHSVDDEVATLDMENLTLNIRGIAKGVAPLVNGQATPTRIRGE